MTTSRSSGDVASRVEATIRPDVRALSAYPVAKAKGLIKLDAMESPYGLPIALKEELGRTLAEVPLNRYPDGPADAVKQALRESLALPADVDLLVGNGSDEILQIITTAIARPNACIVAPDPSFVMYRIDARLMNVRFIGVPLRADFSLDEDAMLAAIAAERPLLVWLAYPNNPTGNRFASSTVERIVRAAPGLVAIDEAYYAYADDSFLPRVLDYDNLVVVRTVSKIGMAGLRLGYVAGRSEWIAELDKVRPPYNVNALTQAALPVVLRANHVIARQSAEIRRERSRVAATLASMHGVEVFPTETNFVMIRVSDADRSFADLLDAGVLVKNLNGWHPLLRGCLRITIGTPAENDALIAALARQS